MVNAVLQASLAVLLMVAIGALLRKVGWLTKEADRPLTDVTMNVLYPAATFFSIRGNEHLLNVGYVFRVVLIGYLTIFLGMVVARLFVKAFGKWSGLQTDVQKRTFILCNCLYNYGYLPIPLCTLLFGVKTLGVLFVFNVGVAMGMWTIAVAALDKNALRQSWKQLFSAPMVGTYLAIALNYLPMTDQLPLCIESALKWLNDCMNPLSLLIVGAIMADEFCRKSEGASLSQSFRVVSASLLLRMLVIPALFILCAHAFVLDPDLQKVIIIQSAMPTAIMSVVWARMFAGDAGIALRIVLVTNLLSIVTVLIWIPIGLKLV